MKAWLLHGIRDLSETNEPLDFADVSEPEPGPGEIRIAVNVCGVCHTELDEIEGRTPPPAFPVILGHQVVGRVDGLGSGADRFDTGDRVGVAWIYSACGECTYCTTERENLCPDFQATGRDAHGGYAEFMTVPEDFAYAIPEGLGDVQVAPLLCAGAIGYRSLRLTGINNGDPLGLTGFGASGHLVLKMAKHELPDSDIHVFARNPDEQEFARELGAAWAGDTEDEAPEGLAAIIDTTPAWKPVVEALGNLRPGGRLVINAIGKEAGDREYLTRIDYPSDLWMEKEIKSVANITRRDVREFLDLAAEMNIRPETQEFDLAEANAALMELRRGEIRGAKVLSIKS